MNPNFLYNNKILRERRRELRNNQTEEERILWSKLKNAQIKNLKFVRQYSIGPYILDFYCPKLRLAIELDGGQHNDLENKLYDLDRDDYLKSVDIKTLRFWNHDVYNNINNVLEKISACIQNPS